MSRKRGKNRIRGLGISNSCVKLGYEVIQKFAFHRAQFSVVDYQGGKAIQVKPGNGYKIIKADKHPRSSYLAGTPRLVRELVSQGAERGRYRLACETEGVLLFVPGDEEPADEEKKLTAEEVTAQIRYLSRDGIAPRSYENETLREAARAFFGSWVQACRVAGVMSRKEAGVQEEYQEKKPDLSSDRKVTAEEVRTYLFAYLVRGQSFKQIADDHRRSKEFVKKQIRFSAFQKPEWIEYFTNLAYLRNVHTKAQERVPS